MNSEKYVGDLVSADGKHLANITARRGKGIGVVNEIFSILNHMGLGTLYFQAALMLRTSMLHSVLLCNSETWLRLTAKELRMLERVDEMLLRKLLETPTSTPGAALYLETGTVPLSLIIKSKRVMFLHHILTRDRKALISQVLWAQIQQPCRGDWYCVVMEDMDTLKLNLTLEDMAGMSKHVLRNQVKKKLEVAALNLLNDKKKSLSKMSNLEYQSLTVQPYLTSSTTSTRLKRLQFKWRTNMVKVGWNYGNKVKCPLCQPSEAEDTQEHLLVCKKLYVMEDSCHEGSTTHDDAFFKRLERVVRKREKMTEKTD